MRKILPFICLCSFIINNVFSQSPGSLDATFKCNELDSIWKPGTGANGPVYASLIQLDGKIIIGGNFTTYSGVSRKCITRLKANGNLDTTFNVGTGFTNGQSCSVQTIALQSDGKIIVGGYFDTYNGVFKNCLVRLNTDGSFDNTFNQGGSGLDMKVVNTCSIQSDDKIIIGGEFTTYNGTTVKNIVRLNADGTIDNTFNVGSGMTNSSSTVVYTSIIQPDGKIIVGGYFSTYHGSSANSIVRIDANGNIDNTFNVNVGSNGTVRALALQTDGKLIIAGNFQSVNGTSKFNIARISPGGGLDFTLADVTDANGGWNTVSDVAIQTDGKIIIGGSFGPYMSTTPTFLKRINSDGTIDATFNQGTGPSTGVGCFAFLSNNTIILGGSFSTYNGVAVGCIANLNTDGTLNTSFNPGALVASSTSYVYSTAVQSDGKILIGGNFTMFKNGVQSNGIARLNTDGTRDTLFNIGTGLSFSNNVGILTALALQTNGKIIIAGFFDSYNGTAKNSFARLNTDGTIDNTFNVGTSVSNPNYIQALAIQTDGKILIGGMFTSYNGTTKKKIARINTNGSIDNTFNPVYIGGNSNGQAHVNTISIQNDGKIIIGGNFDTVGTSAISCIARLNSNGTIDNTFNVGYGVTDGLIYYNGNSYPMNQVNSLAIQTDGKILIGGFFANYDGSASNNLVRINTNGSIDNTFYVGAGPDNNGVNKIIAKSDGRIIIGGDFYSYDGNPSNGLARLLTDGTFDGAFDVATSVDSGGVVTMALQNDNKIIIGGEFKSYNGVAINSLARVNDGCVIPTIIATTPYVSCVGGTLNLSATPSSGVVNWYSNVTGGSSLGAGTNFTTPNILSTTTYYVEVTDGNCVTVSRTPVTATINTVNVSIQASADTVCSGEFVTLTASGASTFTWSNGVFNGVPFTAPSTTTVYTVTGSQNNCSNTKTITIHVGATPVTPDICMVSVDSTSTKNVIIWQPSHYDNIKKYKIYRDAASSFVLVDSVDATQQGVYVDNTSGINPNTTQYRYKINAVDSCGFESAQSLYHQTIWLNTPSPITGGYMLVWYNYAIENTTLNGSYFYRIEADTTGLNNWYAVDSVSNGITIYNHSTLSSTVANITYRVLIVVPGGCDPSRATVKSSRSNIKTATRLVSVNKINSSLKYKVFPNPSSSELNVQLEDITGDVEILLMDVLGNIVYSNSFKSTKNIKEKLNTEMYSKGVYLLKIKNQFGLITERVVLK